MAPKATEGEDGGALSMPIPPSSPSTILRMVPLPLAGEDFSDSLNVDAP